MIAANSIAVTPMISDLQAMVARGIDELREEGAEEQQRLGIAERNQRPCITKPPRGLRTGWPSAASPDERIIFQPSQTR